MGGGGGEGGGGEYLNSVNTMLLARAQQRLVQCLDSCPEQRMDKILRDKQTLDKQRQDRLISSVSQTLTTAVNTKLDKLVRNEMKGQVVPGKSPDFLYPRPL